MTQKIIRKYSPDLKRMFSSLTWAREMAQGVWEVPAADPKNWAESQGSHWKERTNSCGLSLWPPRGPTHMRPQNKNLTKLILKKKKANFKKANSPFPKAPSLRSAHENRSQSNINLQLRWTFKRRLIYFTALNDLFVWVTHRLKRNRESGLRDLFKAKVLNYRYKKKLLHSVKLKMKGGVRK